MKVIVAGLGVQGYKRRAYASANCVASVDPVNLEADYRDIGDIPLRDYDGVLACVPDEPKLSVIRYALSNRKHVLVEKPLWTMHDEQIFELERLAQQNNVVCYTAYNHRFEPHFIRMRDLIVSGELGRIYSCRLFYGNGTARLVRNSLWRDKGAGVLADLGSHLLDTCSFWFDIDLESFSLVSAHTFENRALDHAVVSSEHLEPRIELEMTLCMWRNHFTCDVLGEKGTAHIESLCKWGPSTFIHRTRVFPSGRPIEQRIELVQDDPTWAQEYLHFENLAETNATTDLSQDLNLQRNLRRLWAEATQ